MLTPPEVQYVGNHAWWRTLKVKTDDGYVTVHKNPDFLIKNQKKVIEFNGTYWHKNEYPDDVMQKAWSDIGYALLIIWDHELKDIDSVLNKIATFVEQDTWQMTLL